MDITKTEIERCNRMFDDGFSLITVGADKVPNIKWKEYQTTPMNKDTFFNFYQLASTAGVGVCTGYRDLEVIDVDLKVLPTVKEREAFWHEFTTMLKDNIEDFANKFVIVKTKNYGYHILYRTQKVAGNIKIAKLEGHQEAIIESRGRGGYVWIYDQFVQGKSYSGIKYIDDMERECLWTICKMYNHIEQHEPPAPKKVQQEHDESEIKVWDDYNNKTSVFDLISGEFTIVRKLSNKTVIKRLGATSPHSGYVFNDSHCMYLFSTGTKYPNETLLTPYHIYTIQKHFGNFSASAKDLYAQGFGSRVKPKRIKENHIPVVKNEIITTDFPIDVYPTFIQRYILEISETLNANIDFLGGAILWASSLCVGNAVKIEVKKGWIESGVLWIALVGKAGVGKTHTIKAITDPLEILSGREVRKFADQMEKYEAYMLLDKKDKALAEEVKKPKKTKFIADDITIEALTELHDSNPNGIGILRDELVGWIKDMNKYREGSDLQKYLSCWSNGVLSSDRKTATSSYVEKAFIPIIGGVQPSILSGVYTEENKDNGFIDRILLCYPEVQVEHYNTKHVSDKLLNEYSEFMMYFYDSVRRDILRNDDMGCLKPHLLFFSPEADIEWQRIFNSITDLQNSDDENEYIKSVLPKLKSYVCRFSLLLEVLNCYAEGISITTVSKKSVLSAEKLYEYFLLMAKKNKFNSMEHNAMIETIKFSGKRGAFEKFQVLFEENNNLNKSKVAEQLNVSRQTIQNWSNELKKG